MYEYDIVEAVDETLALVAPGRHGSKPGECVEDFPNSFYYLQLVKMSWVYLVSSQARILVM